MDTSAYANPSLPNDFSLDHEFSRRLNLATQYHPFPSVEPPLPYGGAGYSASMLDMINSSDFERMRIQSMGQMGLYVQPENYLLSDDRALINALSGMNSIENFEHDLFNNGGSNLNGEGIIRYPIRLRRNLNRNGFNLDNTKLESMRTAIRTPRFRPNFSSLENLRGKLFLLAKDQYGCRFLQKKFEDGNPQEIQFIFSEVKDSARELMVDQFGNYLMQKFFGICNEHQINQLIWVVFSDHRTLLAICLDTFGTRAMQKLIEHVTTREQRSLVVSVLRLITVTLTKSENGHHVIEHCLKFFSSEDNKHILNVVGNKCLEIATDKSGCCVIQHCVAHAHGKPWERLVGEVATNALILSEHPYGNYVVQYIVGLEIPQITSKILDQLAGSYSSLAMNKYGSNVVEKCLKKSEEHQALEIVNEIIRSPNFLMVLQDPYGNYVAQSALAVSKGTTRQAMIQLIHIHDEVLHSHPHGKRVLARIRGRRQHV